MRRAFILEFIQNSNQFSLNNKFILKKGDSGGPLVVREGGIYYLAGIVR